MSKIQSEMWPTGSENYKQQHTLGKGPNAVVHHVTCIPNGQEAALKIIPLGICSSTVDEIRREIQMIRLCNHPHLISCKSSFVVEQSLWLIMEYLSWGSFSGIMNYAYPRGFSDEILLSTILRDVIRGMEYLHNTGRVHRALKAGNILLHPTGLVKLGDFGISALLNCEKSATETLDWKTPPEIQDNPSSEYAAKADIWALGITTLELATGPNFRDFQSPLAILDSICPVPGNSSAQEGEFSLAFRNFVEACLKTDPAQRPPVGKLLEFPFFQNVSKSDYLQQQLCEKIPPLWERSQQPVASSSTQPLPPISPRSSLPSQISSAPQLSSQATPPNQKETLPSTPSPTPSSDKVQVGRFTKTVIKPQSLPNEKNADHFEEDCATQSTLSALLSLDPLQILIELQRQVQSMSKELDSLRAQNISLKRDIAAKKGINIDSQGV